MKRALQILLAVGVSVFFVWMSLRHTNVQAVWEAITHADLRWVFAYVAVLVLIHFIRTIRWGLLLEPLVKVPFRELNPLSAVGIAALMLLPLRLGEFARPLLAAEHLKVSRSSSMASIAVERIIDGLVMALLLVALLWSIPPRPGDDHLAYYRVAGGFIAAGWGVGLAALIFAVRHQARAVALLRLTVGRFSKKLEHRIEEMLIAFIDGLKVLPSVGKAVQFFALTAAYWFLAGYGLKLLAPGFNLELSMIQAFTVLGMQVVGAMIPAGPGMVGTFQFFSALGVGFFVANATSSPTVAAFSNTVWALQFLQQSAFGLWFIALGRVRPHEVLVGLTGRGKDESDKNAELASSSEAA